MPAPKTEILLSKTVTPIVFDLVTIDRIEETLNKSATEIVQYIASLNPRTDGKELTEKQKTEASRRFKVGFAARFIAAAADLPPTQIRTEDVLPAWGKCVEGFILAFNQLQGEASDPKDVSGESEGSPPGPDSTSTSSPPSSGS